MNMREELLKAAERAYEQPGKWWGDMSVMEDEDLFLDVYQDMAPDDTRCYVDFNFPGDDRDHWFLLLAAEAL